MDYLETFRPLFDELNFNLTKVFREGPRFFVVGGDYKSEKAIFKADVEDPKAENRRAYLKLRREAAFLESVDSPHIPSFYIKGNQESFFWLLEEWVPGESQELEDSTFLIKDTFFTQENLDFCLEFLTSLHRMPQNNKTPEFEEFKEKFAKRYTLQDYASLIASDKENLVGEELMGRIDAFIDKRHDIFNSNQTVMAHHEFYAPHIFLNGGELKVIDWENVGWGNPAYDFAELWIRSFAKPDFREELLNRFREVQEEKDMFDQLLSLEIVLQGLGNLKYFNFTDLPEEKEVSEGIRTFLLDNINRVLAKDGRF